jgi:cell division protein FtsQ
MIKTIKISLLIIYTLAIAGLFVFVVINGGETKVSSTTINIFRDSNRGFLNADSISSQLKKVQEIDSVKLVNLKVSSLEDVLIRNPYVDEADIFTGLKGELMVNMKEKKPLLRIFNKKSKGYYVTEDGDILPLSKNFTARVIVVNGYINIPVRRGYNNVYDSVYDKTSIRGILELSKKINGNEFLKAQINQIYLNSKKEFELIPELGNQTIILGKLTKLDIKLRNLEAFYQQALLEEGLNKYKSINLRFDGQIVCTK